MRARLCRHSLESASSQSIRGDAHCKLGVVSCAWPSRRVCRSGTWRLPSRGSPRRPGRRVSPRVGRLDAYPEAGHMRTSAMAEGAIDGEAESYEVAGPYANALRLLSLRRTEAGAAAGGAPGARNADGGGSAGCARRTRGGSDRGARSAPLLCGPPVKSRHLNSLKKNAKTRENERGPPPDIKRK